MISICIPCTNRPRKLFEAICSILMQGVSGIELVLKDNSAVPVTEDPCVAAALKMLPGSVNYRAGEPLPLFRSVNDCMERATGDIRYFMGDDDLLAPGALISVLETFEGERFPNVFWVVGKTISADQHGRTQGIDGGPTTYEKMLECNRIGGPSVFVGRGIAALTGKFETRYSLAADYDYWLRLWRWREPMFIDRVLGIYRHHEGQTSVTKRDELEREAKMISERHKNFGDLIRNAHAIQQSRPAYGAEGFPPEHA